MILFVTGKFVSQNNQIEGFGIKLNFNNPSFLLVVAGIGVVLVPRVLPDPARLSQLPPPAARILGVQQTSTVNTPAPQPAWIDNGVAPAQVTRQGDQLQMTYDYSGAHITAVWEGGDAFD